MLRAAVTTKNLGERVDEYHLKTRRLPALCNGRLSVCVAIDLLDVFSIFSTLSLVAFKFRQSMFAFSPYLFMPEKRCEYLLTIKGTIRSCSKNPNYKSPPSSCSCQHHSMHSINSRWWQIFPKGQG
ncbi:hypothetical protein P152DRAFT_71154 [Eremomyces bilateralis CBS 781.70]|uniref:Uncharacterized protein n=1 Tax=Eremomyces bilateralis CBS 781.70 TaxID=1392243 RepID=A0A6G1G021_9PEZI|nr:uncharacterized protein P152DRAFT_71154 [Eremomyces bilateralis CBS 781.70]KAF1811368.1 hypothetical protein P152DRAFT_71154 [Eremomyces bilateralis CBS 781.70]